MKKTMMMILAISLVFALAAPAMAETAVEFSGSYFVRGTFINSGYFSDDDGPAWSGESLDNHRDDWYDQEMRLNVTFRANENVAVFWRFDIGDFNWGGATEQNRFGRVGTGSDYQLDRLWASITTPYGKLDVGRMAGGQWGLAAFDYSNNGVDRIKFTTQVGDLILLGIIEKRLDGDMNEGSNAFDDDADQDVYYLAGVYKQETWEAGLLSGYARLRNNAGATVASVFFPTAGGGAGQRANVTEIDQIVLIAYGIFNFGPFTIQGEVGHEDGKVDYAAANAKSSDIDTWYWNLEAQYSAGPFSASLGFIWVEGQDESEQGKTNLGQGGDVTAANAGNSGIGNDFAPLLLMTNWDAAVNDNTTYPTVATRAGMELWYMSASYAVTETLTFGLAAGYGEAEEDWDGGYFGTVDYDDSYGWEVDLTLSWDAMDNVNYSVGVAYFDAGDLYAQAHNGVNGNQLGSSGDEVWGMRHTLTISF